jgi:hypothetical protein
MAENSHRKNANITLCSASEPQTGSIEPASTPYEARHMIEITDEMVEAARLARYSVNTQPLDDCTWRIILTAVAPLIAAAERARLEEAAKPGPMPTREEIEKFLADCAKWREENGFA